MVSMTSMMGKKVYAAVAVIGIALTAATLSGQTPDMPAGPGADAPKPPAYVPKGPPPPADDPVPAPTVPAASAGMGRPAGTAAGADNVTPPGSTTPDQWSTEQILTATVHQAWLLAGKNEDNFFRIVRQLAEISAQNRGLELPDKPEAGKRAGRYIRTQAKADHNALLYPIVDKAVQMTGKPEMAHAAAHSVARPAASAGH